MSATSTGRKEILPSSRFPRLPAYTSPATRAGNLLFLAGQTGVDHQGGRLVRSLKDLGDRARPLLDLGLFGNLWDDTIRGPVAAQAWVILDNVRVLLEDQGGSIDDLVKVTVYLRDLQTLSAFELAWQLFFPANPPARTVIGVHGDGMNPDIRVIVDATAAVPRTVGGPGARRIANSTIGQPAGSAAVAGQAGEVVFVSGLIGLNRETGKVATRLAELGPAAEKVRALAPVVGPQEEAVMAQTYLIHQQTRELLEGLGSSLDNVLQHNIFLRDFRRDFVKALPVNKLCFPTDPPACTGFGYDDLRGGEEVLVEVELIALAPAVPGGVVQKGPINFDPSLTKPTTHYTMATSSHDLLFLSGRAGINWQADGAPVLGFPDLAPWQAEYLGIGRVDATKPVYAQAWYCCNAIQQIIQTQGAGLQDVAKLTIFLQDLGDFPAVEAVCHGFWPESPPACVVVPISEATPHPELVVEIEPIVALTGK
ncbi:MAG: RidA family protein [Chloroflexi bacterium]|nr:RidA family protein [Chloroflexota bacterium]